VGDRRIGDGGCRTLERQVGARIRLEPERASQLVIVHCGCPAHLGQVRERPDFMASPKRSFSSAAA
jgi:hypothetical protein